MARGGVGAGRQPAREALLDMSPVLGRGVGRIDAGRLDEVAMGAYEDQCAPANPRMPMLADMKDLMTAAYYGTSLADVRGRREQQGACGDAPQEAVPSAGPEKSVPAVPSVMGPGSTVAPTEMTGSQAVIRALEELGVTPAAVAELQGLVDAGSLNDKLARQVLEGVVAGEGSPSEVVEARGLAVVSDEGALVTAVDEALAANPDVAGKIRSGKVAAAGAIVGAVMRATRGQADAARVRELVLERVGG